MSDRHPSTSRHWLGPTLLLGAVAVTGVLLAVWKHGASLAAETSATSQPEPIAVVTVATAEPRQHREATTAIGTVLALQSITLRNELAGTVRQASLTPGQVVEAGTILVALDTSEESALLQAEQAEATLAETTLARLERLRLHQAVSQEEVDQARARLDVARAQIARTRAIIAKKTIRAPFRARVGIADVHPGQYLNEGVELTTLQGISDEANVDFAVAQGVAAGLRAGMAVEVLTDDDATPHQARIVAVDARVDPVTRNATVRARLVATNHGPRPGASVQVKVPVGPLGTAMAIPVSALRKGPDGDHVWIITPDSAGVPRAHERKVEAGSVLGDTVLVLTGLTAGDRVAASGSFKLRESARVQSAEQNIATTGTTASAAFATK
jgi:membrane fusion protein (multidrug efflux system)